MHVLAGTLGKKKRGTGTGMPSLMEKLEYYATRQPDAPFVETVESDETLTYAGAYRAVAGLRRLLGTEPRTIALAVPGGIVAAVVWLAALTGGHRLVPLSPEATADERAHMGRRVHPDVLIVERTGQERAFDVPSARCYTSGDLMERIATWAVDASPHDVPAAEGSVRLTTSGTTGEPKGVILTASQIAWTADHIRSSHRLTSADRGLTPLPFFHVNAPVVSLCASLMAGATVVIAPRFSRQRFWEWVEREEITWASIVPTIVALLLQTEKPAFLPGKLRFVRTASAPLPAAHLLAFESRFGVPVVETYGLSEAGSQVAANPVPPGKRKPGSVGVPVGVEMRVCVPRLDADDHSLTPVAVGHEGEICVKGPGVIAGYEGGAGAESFVGGWFRTGDVGHQDSEGYIYITGRLRDVINRGGEKIAPREIEEVLLQHPELTDAAVVGEPDPLYGQHVAAYVVPANANTRGLVERLRAYAAERLTAYKVPEVFYAVETLPRNRTGKIARQMLLQREVIAARELRAG